MHRDASLQGRQTIGPCDSGAYPCAGAFLAFCVTFCKPLTIYVCKTDQRRHRRNRMP
ncbi:hypothetical protein XAP412_180051 [Xanthomonas phaseoli pv. phaseoli]|uniref:Uncharacterized protein n=1 Tax=Xanthomonas campestris pv. phaseoli TaxID=317013 RepID=A0AB38DYZ8_XANCH|nr:hypothetical protein XAP6984_250114 [Xanthomonas phaseoli pv. phaseoli]SON80660.1 hypothetical protein XAP412_180051 [Xanthomonas phaseoli pv. phaseoli]SON85325.1 hypothetical protein XAP7430_200052 [Xanthomonas phaseoli pv. phaseoli]